MRNAETRIAAPALALILLASAAPSAATDFACGPEQPYAGKHVPTGTLLRPDRWIYLYFKDPDGLGELSSATLEVKGPWLPGITPEPEWKQPGGAGGEQFDERTIFMSWVPASPGFSPGHYHVRASITTTCPDAQGNPTSATFEWSFSVGAPYDRPVHDEFWGPGTWFQYGPADNSSLAYNVDSPHLHAEVDPQTLDYSKTYFTTNVSVNGTWVGRGVQLSLWLQPGLRPPPLP